MKKYYAKTLKGGFNVEAKDVAGAWKAAKKEEKEINDARKELGLVNFNYHLCKVVKILKAKD